MLAEHASCESIASSGIAAAAAAAPPFVDCENTSESDDSKLSESPRVPHVGAASGAQKAEASLIFTLPHI